MSRNKCKRLLNPQHMYTSKSRQNGGQWGRHVTPLPMQVASWGVVVLNISWMKKMCEGPWARPSWSKFFTWYIISSIQLPCFFFFFWRGNVLCPIKEHKHPSHSKDPRADICTHFQPFCHIALFWHSHSRESPSLCDYRKEDASNEQGASGASSLLRPLTAGLILLLSGVPGFASSTEKGSVRSRGQPEVPRSSKTVLCVRWQRYWIF